ncbi:MAG: ATP-binding protein [Desulfobaccales bacterium]|jgi:hypothetical protein
MKYQDQQGNPPVEKAQAVNFVVDVDVKVKILQTIAKAIYATPIGKIREAVANAMDNEATWIIIMADRTTKSLCIYDNGNGISKDHFQEIFKSIGYGLLSDEPSEKLSYFGLGLMSIFKLGKKVKVFTRHRGEEDIVVVNVSAEEFFSKKNQDKSIKELKEYVSFGHPEERKSSNAPSLDDYIENTFEEIPPHFTEIVIEDVIDEDLNAICDPSFATDIRKVLPLRVEDDEPFLKRFVGDKAKDIKKLLENKTFCRTIDVFFGVKGENSEQIEPEEVLVQQEEINQLWKYFPKFRSDLVFPDSNIYFCNADNREFAFYIVHTIAKDLYRETQDIKENGFWVRNQNFLVKAADFMEKPGPGRRIIDQPLRNWIFGEIFHKNMNRFLTVSRTEYLFDDKDFREFRDEIFDIVRPLNRILREIWEKKNEVVDGVIDPFKNITEPGGPFQIAEQRLRRMVDPKDEQGFHKDMFERLNAKRVKEIEVPEARVDVILPKASGEIPLGEDDKLSVCIDPNLKDEQYQVSWDKDKETVKVSISPELFKPREVVFLGKTFTVVFVAKKESDPGVSVDIDHYIIYVNPFNKELIQYSVSIIDVLIALEIADAISNDQTELKKNFLTIIGAKTTVAVKYVTPLGDELRRLSAFATSGE